jgi:hypothetical protein
MQSFAARAALSGTAAILILCNLIGSVVASVSLLFAWACREDLESYPDSYTKTTLFLPVIKHACYCCREIVGV